MPTRANWGIIVVASACAVVLIGLAFWFASSGNGTPPIGATTGATTASNGDWQTILTQIAATTTNANGEYNAPKELTPTDALSRELFVKYAQLSQDPNASAADKQSAFNALVAENAAQVKATVTYTLGSIHTSSSVAITTYDANVSTILRRSTAIKEYELTTFSKAVGATTIAGTASLKTASQIYRGIEKDLVAMTVPTSMQKEHLALVQSISSLADATYLMGTWSGDPLNALVYIDAFTRADTATQSAVAAIYNKMVVLAKKS